MDGEQHTVTNAHVVSNQSLDKAIRSAAPMPRLQRDVTYTDLLAVVRLMQGFPAPWYVSGGWAIDALVGHATRSHEDIEIGLARQDQGLLHLHPHLAAWQLYKVVHNASRNDADLLPWAGEEHLELPIHQIVAQCAEASPPEFEFFLNEVWAEEWQFRKERSIHRPFAQSTRQTGQDIPVLAPELQLLYKATLHRPKDEHDFQIALGYLGREQRVWLRQALERVHPDDPWLDALT